MLQAELIRKVSMISVEQRHANITNPPSRNSRAAVSEKWE